MSTLMILAASVFIERELTFTFAICYRRSSICLSSSSFCLSVTFVRPTQPVEIFGNFFRRLVPWPSIDIHRKFYGDRPWVTHPWGGGLNARGVAKYTDFWNLECCISETVQCRR